MQMARAAEKDRDKESENYAISFIVSVAANMRVLKLCAANYCHRYSSQKKNMCSPHSKSLIPLFIYLVRSFFIPCYFYFAK